LCGGVRGGFRGGKTVSFWTQGRKKTGKEGRKITQRTRLKKGGKVDPRGGGAAGKKKLKTC